MSVQRPRTMLGLTARLLALRYERALGPSRLALLVVASVAALVSARSFEHRRVERSPTPLATFNIENDPKNGRQEAPTFELLRTLNAAAVGVQEIVDPVAFASAARSRLGAHWRFVHSVGEGSQRVGVLYDSDRLELLSSRQHREVVTYPGAKPMFEARLRDGATVLRMLVVHLEAGGDGARERQRQYAAMLPVVREAVGSGERVVVLGDFNATGPEDRAELRALSGRTNLRWASEPLSCTSYWARRDGCLGQALDHVLASTAPSSIAVRGACERVGCSPGALCPAERELISDHCPVVFDL